MANLGNIRTQARVDKLLVGVSQRQNVAGLIGDQVLTNVSVKQQTGLLGKYKNGHLRIEADLVGGETPYPQYISDVHESDRYVLEKHGLKSVITEEDFMNEEQPFDVRSDRTMDITDKLKLSKEFALATQLTNTAVLTNNVTLSGTDQLSDYANSDPIGRFKTARESVYEGVGMDLREPGAFAIVPWNVRETLRFHTKLIENIKYSIDASKGLSDAQLADVLGVNKMMVPFARYNSAKEGQTDTLIPVWGKHIVFAWSPPTGRKKMLTLGFQARKRNGIRVFRYAIKDPPNAEKVLVDHEYDLLITTVGAGYLIKDAIA